MEFGLLNLYGLLNLPSDQLKKEPTNYAIHVNDTVNLEYNLQCLSILLLQVSFLLMKS